MTSSAEFDCPAPGRPSSSSTASISSGRVAVDGIGFYLRRPPRRAADWAGLRIRCLVGGLGHHLVLLDVGQFDLEESVADRTLDDRPIGDGDRLVLLELLAIGRGKARALARAVFLHVKTVLANGGDFRHSFCS